MQKIGGFLWKQYRVKFLNRNLAVKKNLFQNPFSYRLNCIFKTKMCMKILLVDDNPQSRKMICKYLRASNAEIAEREDGAEALSAYQQFQPDWVLMDWEMKNLNGLEATRQIIKSYPQANVIIVTNYDEKDLRQTALEAGAKGFILKDDLTSLNSFLQ